MQKLGIALLLITFIQFKTAAQVTPQPSPGASFSQTVGITEIIVDYSRPGVKGRTIFGGLLPFGKVWRTGANATTQISFSSDVRINDMPLIAGTYSIVSFPGEETWIIVFSNDLEVTEADYDPRFDALRVFVKPQKANFTETFTINLSDVQENGAMLNILWEETQVSLNLTVDNEYTIVSAIEAKNNEAAGAFQQAAEYMVNREINIEKALEYVDKSISLKQTVRNTWIKSVILRKLGDNDGALNFALKAKELGMNDPIYSFFEQAIETAIIELSGK